MNLEIITLIQSVGFTYRDIAAVILFFTAWIAHYWIVNHSPWRSKTISGRMSVFRQRWMNNMVYRSPKMPDTIIQNSLQYGVLFFASTSILLVGALMAGLGASDQAIELLGELPFAVKTTRTVWEIKVLLVTFIFIFAFFKFAWSYRLFNYVFILIGAAPDVTASTARQQQDSIDPDAYAVKVGQLHTLGARHFTTGLNSYFFALAACAWFVSPLFFMCATVWVSIVLYRRAFWSIFGETLTGIEGLESSGDAKGD